MGNKSALNLYMASAFKIVLLMMSGSALCASLTIVALKLLGSYTLVSWAAVAFFLGSTIVYIVTALLLSRRIVSNGELNRKVLFGGKIYFAVIVGVQYNFLLYLVPVREVWYVSAFFLFFAVLFLDCRLTALAIGELLCSILVSRVILGETPLPVRDDFFAVSLVMQIVVLALFCAVSYLATYFLHKFLVSGSDSRMSVVLKDLASSNQALRLTERQRMEAAERANTDPLTGLFNRRYADLFFTTVLNKRGKDARYCVALLNIDDFKLVNDAHGHSCGDQLLAYLSGYIRSSLRKSDYVFRWGGEEFLIVLNGVDLPAARGILEKLRFGVSAAPVETQEAALRVTVTIGVAELGPDDIAASIKLCDDRMYQGKRNGKNRVVVE